MLIDTHSQMTPGEIARLSGRPTHTEHVIRMTAFTAEGDAHPPISVTVRCSPDDADGISRTFTGALLRSRGWHCTVEESDVEVADE